LHSSHIRCCHGIVFVAIGIGTTSSGTVGTVGIVGTGITFCRYSLERRKKKDAKRNKD